jgi:hypothetical protein
LDKPGAIVLRLKISRGQLGRRLSNMPRCLIGMEACSGSHHIGRQLAALGQNVRLIPAQYVRPFLNGHKNDYRESGEFAQSRRAHHALHAEGEERAQRSDGEEIAWRAQRNHSTPPVTTAIAAALSLPKTLSI